MTRRPIIERRRTSTALALYTGASIVAGFAALGWATVAYPLVPTIGNPRLPDLAGDASTSGLLFWVALGLLGSLRTTALGRRAVLTFHLPFIVAAMTLGGPVAGGWVAAISSLELRELREVPWFGTLANHADLALAGVVGGFVVVSLDASLAALVDPQLATLVAAAGGAFAFCALDVAMPVITVGLREHLTPAEARATFEGSYRQSVGVEVILGWLLALAYGMIAWWAPILGVGLVLLVWQANDDHEATREDPMTGLLNRKGFEERWAATVARVRRGRQQATLVMVDLDGFKNINDTLGHTAGDDVIRAAGARLRAAVRVTDAAARLGGDEFALLLLGVPDAHSAERLVSRIHARLCEPLRIAAGDVELRASLGLVFLDAASAAGGALDVADKAMYEAKRHGGGVELAATA